MKNRLALAAFLAVFCVCVYFVGCDSASNPVAPTGSVLTITANPTNLSLSGGRSTLTISGFRPDGNPLNPGTQVNVSTSLGNLTLPDGSPANVVEVAEGGFATVYLRGDGRQGTATVTASLITGGETGTASVDVQIGVPDTDRPTVTVDANPTDVAVNEPSTITVTARNADNTPLAGATVSLRTSLGNLSLNDGSTTNTNGEVSATLTSSQSGTATVTASVGASEEVTAEVNIGTTRKPVVTLSANPSSVDEGEISVVTVTARDENGNLLPGSSTAILSADRGFLQQSGGDSFRDDELSLSNGRATVSFVATGPPGDGEVTAFVQNSDIASETITVRGVPANLGLRSSGTIPSSGPGTITLTATVTNDESIRLQDQSVTFVAYCDVIAEANNIGGNFNPNPAFTNTNGEATSTVVVNTDSFRDACGDDPENVIFRASAGSDANGQEVFDTVIVQIGSGGSS